MFKTIYKYLLQISGFLFLVLLVNCTENPFWKENKISGNSVRGKVRLNSYLSPDDVHVWFKALDISTRTDENGEFTLHFPPPSKQPSGGIDGVFDLYFFVANYQWQSVPIVFINGNVQYSKESVGNNGELRKTVVLSEILKIKTTYSQTMLTETLEDSIHVSFTVNTFDDEPIALISNFTTSLYPGDPEFLTGLLLDSNKNVVKMFTRRDRTIKTVEILIEKTPKTLVPVIVILAPGEFPAGEYYIVPYSIIQHKNLPAGLLKSIGNNITRFSPDYLKIPLKIRANKFTISN